MSSRFSRSQAVLGPAGSTTDSKAINSPRCIVHPKECSINGVPPKRPEHTSISAQGHMSGRYQKSGTQRFEDDAFCDINTVILHPGPEKAGR